MVEWLLAGSTALALVEGFFLWREVRLRSRAQEDAEFYQAACAQFEKENHALHEMAEEKDDRIEELEVKLAASNPAELFDDLFGMRGSTPSDRDPD